MSSIIVVFPKKEIATNIRNILVRNGFDVIGVGKIHDIFCGEGITETHHSDSSVHGMEQTIEICKRDFRGLCFVNLVDFVQDGDISVERGAQKAGMTVDFLIA